MTTIEIGRMLRAGTSGFVVGCRVSQLNLPSFGALVSVPLEDSDQVYGLICHFQVFLVGVFYRVLAWVEFL